MLKRLILSLLVLLLLASPAWALKKVLIFRPEDNTSTAWMLQAITSAIVEGGGSYETIMMTADTTCTDSIAATLPVGTHKKVGMGLAYRLWHARDSGKYGLVVVLTVQEDEGGGYLTGTLPGYALYGRGKFAKYCDMSLSPIGIPTVLCSRKGISRINGLHCGSTCATNWSKGSVGGGAPGVGQHADSLWARMSTGDSVLWYKAAGSSNDRRHLAHFTNSPENGYAWTADIWTKRGSDKASQTFDALATLYMWHVHASLADQRALPGAGQDSVIYYLPNWNITSMNNGYDSEIKAFASLLKKYGCIKGIPVSVGIDDLAFYGVNPAGTTLAQELVAADTFLQYCSDQHLPVNCNVQYCRTDTTTFVPFMARWYSNPYVHFGWHPSTLWTDAAKSGVYSVFLTWGSGSWATGGDHTKLLVDLKRDRYLLGTSGMLQYMKDNDVMIFNASDYNGVGGAVKDKCDTIFSALSAVGVRTFIIETAGASGFYPSSHDLFTIFHPYASYPIDLTWTGSATTVNSRMNLWWYQGLAGGDSTYATPALLSDSAIVCYNSAHAPIAINYCYAYFARSIFTNGRIADGGGTGWGDDTQAMWPHIYNLESRGWGYYSHPNGMLMSKDNVRYNSSLLWLKHIWNNLRAYNHLAQNDDPTIGNLFEPTFLSQADQRVGPK